MRLAAPMCYVPLQLSTCNLQRSLHLEGHSLRVTARCLFAHLLRQSAWLTYDEVAHLMMPWVKSELGDPLSTQRAQKPKCFYLFLGMGSLPEWHQVGPAIFRVCLFVCCSVGDCFQITLNQKQMSEIFDWFCFALPFSIPTFNVHYSAALDEIARKVRKVYWSNHRLGRLFPAEPGVCCDNASSKDKRSI